MNKVFYLLLLLLISTGILNSQPIVSNRPDTVHLLTDADIIRYDNVSKLKLSEAERNIPLPVAVNNAENRWMIPIFWQIGNECGQASSVCYTLSYELLRRRNQDYMWGYDFQYPSRFAWNFCNKGENIGANFMESWEVIRTAGTPTVNEWGGWYNYGEATRWISGYDIYHSAMRNRISEMYAIPTNTEEGLLTLKHWLYDHLNGETSGGLANFYCQYRNNDYLDLIPEGSPQAGMHILTEFGSSVNHSKTIVGYDDEVRWDYNGDGQFTNNVDINGDGVVDMRDWEVGAVIFCNTFGTDFGDDGYCYLPYCKLASLPAEGGIWNTCVYVVQAKDEVFPQITYKATIQHTSREKIKVSAGVANNTNANQPEHVLDFYVFHNQGGDNYMQGGSTNDDKTLEFGLDVSPLLNYIQPGQPAKFFFNVEETDPSDEDNGLIVNFSLMDYTSGTEVEQAHPSSNVTIQNNSTTTLSLVRAINFSKPVIQDSILPEMTALTEYTHQLTATNGKPNYRWEIDRNFQIEEFAEGFPSNTGQQIQLSNNSNGYVIIPLDFDFPYYGDEYNNLVVYADGYIAFHHQTANWPFLHESEMQVLAKRMICPFKADLSQCAVYKQGDSEKMTLFFTAAVAGQTGSSVNFVVRIHKTGIIEYFYGDMNFTESDYWSALIRGDQQVNQHLPVSGVAAAQIQHRNFRMTPSMLPEGLTLSPTGLLKGKSNTAFTDATFSVTCYDNNDVKDSRTLHLSCDYDSRLVVTSCKVNDQEDPYLYVGDTMNFTITVKNIDTLAYTGCQLRLRSSDPSISWIDSTEYFGYIAPNNEYILHGCATCAIAENTPAGHIIHIDILVENNLSNSSISRSYELHNYDIPVLYYRINNDTRLFTVNDTVPVVFTLKNNGSKLENVKFKVRYDNPQLQPIADSLFISELGLNAVFQFPTTTWVSNAFMEGTTVDAYIDIFIHNRLVKTHTVPIIGERSCMEFEDDNIPSFFTMTSSATDWSIDTTESYSGLGSFVSGGITHNGTCSFSFSSILSQRQEISFAFKTSTEAKYDWLYFYIDDEQMGRWAGFNDWTPMSYELEPGEHTFLWTYTKDYSVSDSIDKVWIDDICLSEAILTNAQLSTSEESVEVTLGLYNNAFQTVPMQISNPGSALVLLTTAITDANGNTPSWVTCDMENEYLTAGGTRPMTFSFNSMDCEPIDYEATMTVRFTGGYLEIPITMHILDDVGIDSYSSDHPLNVYPNPTSGVCTILSEQQTIRSIILYDTFGRMLQQERIDDFQANLDLSSYRSGIYLLKIETEDGQTITHKIVKR